MELRPYQKEAVDALHDWFCSGKEKPCVVFPTGCHAAGTEILMYDGSVKKVEDVVVGDIIMGDDNTPRFVLNLARGSEMMYKITPNSGEPFVVNENHILSLKATNEGKKWASSYKGDEYELIKVKDYINKTKYYKHIMKLYRKNGVELTKKLLPLDPYFVGLCLGDGHLKNTLTITTEDDIIIQYCQDFAIGYGCSTYINYKKNSNTVSVCFRYKGANRWGIKNPIVQSLKDIGIWGHLSDTKFIPNEYKTSSFEDRLQILAGLIDTDGHLSRGTTFEYISKSERLAKDVQFISRSLGLRANFRPCNKKCQTGAGGIYYRVFITGDINIVPTKLVRKKGNKRKQKKSPLKTGFKIESCGIDNFYGFELSGNHLYLTSDFIVHHNTGKSLLQAAFIQSVLQEHDHVRVICVTHSKELVKQNYDEMLSIWPDCPAGIWSAGLRRKENKQIIFAGIQSIYSSSEKIGAADIIIVDECHRLSKKSGAMYNTFFDSMVELNASTQIMGMTATPYRMDLGNIVPDILDGFCYEYPIWQAIKDGYLCNVISAPVKTKLTTEGVHLLGGEFKPSELEAAVNVDSKTRAAVAEIIEFGADRKSWLVFASGNSHAKAITDVLIQSGVNAACVTHETPQEERDALIAAHKSGELKCLVNNMILTTGYNNPMVDMIACLRPTKSESLWVQIVGRGMRLFNEKPNCLLLDFGMNLSRHGPIDKIKGTGYESSGNGEAPHKVCPKCYEAVHIAALECPNCGCIFEIDATPKITEKASDERVFSNQAPKEITLDVLHARVSRHQKEGSAHPCLKITYSTLMGNIYEFKFLGHPHGTILRRQASKWAQSQGLPFSASLDLALSYGGYNHPSKLVVIKDGKYYKIKERIFQQ